MIVLLRCPNCGTTRDAPGECDACHAAAVQYFCTNHKPGLWLETPVCPQCGSRFGAPAPRASPSVLVKPVRSRPAAVPLPRRASPPPTPPDPTPDPSFEYPRVGVPVAPLWLTLLRNAILSRRRTAGELPGRERPRRGRGGCLLRAFLLLLFGFLSLLVMLAMFGWSLLRGY